VLPQGLNLKINALGLENSRRGKRDGFVYFGYQTDTDKVFNNIFNGNVTLGYGRLHY